MGEQDVLFEKLNEELRRDPGLFEDAQVSAEILTETEVIAELRRVFAVEEEPEPCRFTLA